MYKTIRVIAYQGGYANGEDVIVSDPLKAKDFKDDEDFQRTLRLFKGAEGKLFNVSIKRLNLGIHMQPEEYAAYDIVGALRQRSDMDSEIRHYITRSKLFSAICKHIVDARVCYIIDRLDHPIQMHRGTGASINFRKAYLYAPDFKSGKRIEANVFALYISVAYYDKEDSEAGIDNLREYQKDYSIDLPIDLLLKFTQKGFDEWVASIKKNALRDLPEKEMKDLEKLIKKYPKGAHALIESLKKKGVLE